MTRCRFLSLLFIVFLSACASYPSGLKYGALLNSPGFKGQDVLYVEAINLTEDASVLSTKDDEALIFLYSLEADNSLKFCFLEKSRFAENRLTMQTFDIQERPVKFLLIILEQDSDLQTIRYDEIIQKNIDQMKIDHLQKNYASIESYLGDDDIIAIQEMTYPSKKVYIHHGSHRGDQYEYRSYFQSKK